MSADWDGLNPVHRRYLEQRTVTAEVAAARGYRSAELKKELKELGFSEPQLRVPALVVPIWGLPADVVPACYQVRPDSPRWNGEGKPRKFELPPKTKLRLDASPVVSHLARDSAAPMVLIEGTVKGDAVVSRLGVFVIAVVGVFSWRDGQGVLPDWEFLALKSRDVLVAYDSDVMLKPTVHEALQRSGEMLEHRGARVHYVYLPPGDNGRPVGADDWVASRLKADPGIEPGKLLAELAGMSEDKRRGTGPKAPPAPKYEAPTRRTLAAVDKAFRKWLDHPDVDAVRVVLAAVAANCQPGDPVWLLVVAPPSSGKTELVLSVCGPPDIHLVGELSCPALLSGTPKQDQQPGATGGVLRRVGAKGLLVSKDFGAVLAMKFEDRARLLQALRDVFDGHYDRQVGADGGRPLTWDGSCGFIAGTTEAIDTHHSVIAQLGDRFVMIRLELPADATEQASKAIAGGRDEQAMRAELAAAVGGLLGHLRGPWPQLAERARKELAGYAALIVRCRSVVERDRWTRDITSVPRSEQPARVAKELAKLFRGLLYIGCAEADAWRIMRRLTRDSMPAVRRQALDYVFGHAGKKTSSVGIGVGLPTSTVLRALEDLRCHGVVDREGGEGTPYTWRMPDWAAKSWPASSEERSESFYRGEGDFAGKVPEGDEAGEDEPDDGPDQDEDAPGFEEAF